jgi:hypothetical protein
MLENVGTARVLRVPNAFLHRKPITHLAVNWKNPPLFVLGLTGMKPNLVAFEIELIPAERAQLAQPITQMIGNNEKGFQIIRTGRANLDIVCHLESRSGRYPPGAGECTGHVRPLEDHTGGREPGLVSRLEDHG